MPSQSTIASPATRPCPSPATKPSCQASAFPLRALRAATLRELASFRQGDYPPVSLKPGLAPAQPVA